MTQIEKWCQLKTASAARLDAEAGSVVIEEVTKNGDCDD